MDRFQLKVPVAAIRYAAGRNETEVYDFVRSVASGSLSFSNAHARGCLHLYGGALDVYLDDGDWVVDMQGKAVHLSAVEFDQIFAPAGD